MKLSFYHVSTCGTNCISSLFSELSALEDLADPWEFPYEILLCLRCGKGSNCLSRRFDHKESCLMIDIQREDRIFQPLSKNEQREYLGKMIISSLKESISTYPKMATSKQRAGLLYEVEQWMVEHGWLHGVIEQALLLLKAGSGTYEVSEQLHLSLDEVEDLYLSQYGIEHRKELHPDNVSEGKAGSFIE